MDMRHTVISFAKIKQKDEVSVLRISNTLWLRLFSCAGFICHTRQTFRALLLLPQRPE